MSRETIHDRVITFYENLCLEGSKPGKHCVIEVSNFAFNPIIDAGACGDTIEDNVVLRTGLEQIARFLAKKDEILGDVHDFQFVSVFYDEFKKFVQEGKNYDDCYRLATDSLVLSMNNTMKAVGFVSRFTGSGAGSGDGPGASAGAGAGAGRGS